MPFLNKKNLALLALSSTKYSLQAEETEDNNMYFPVSFDVGGAVVLSELMQNPDVFNDVLDHGCHCSLLDLNSDQDILGGHEPLDELDSICRQWLIARNCNDRLVGGACYNQATRNMTYGVYEDNDFIPHCEPGENDCKNSACKIDLYYATQIMDWVMWNPFEVQKVEFEGTCQWTELPDVNRVCEGQAPDVQVRVLGDKLTHRILSREELVQECSEAVFDITVLVDGSGSVLPDDYANSINFIQDLLSLFNISEYGTRVTLAQFSTDLRTYTINTGDEITVTSMIDFMKKTQFRKGTMTNSAINTMNTYIQSFGRPEAKQFVIILTDGESNNGISNVQTFHDNGVTVFSIGVGQGINQDELMEMATDPHNEYLYMLDDFNALQDVFMTLTIGSNICIKADKMAELGINPEDGENMPGMRSFGERKEMPPRGVVEWKNPDGFVTDEDVEL